jgi:hypothetical protein
MVSLDTGSSITLSVDTTLFPTSIQAAQVLSFPPIPSASCGPPVSFAALGATPGDTVAPSWPGNLPLGFVGQMAVPASDTISVQLCNLSQAGSGVITGTFGATDFSVAEYDDALASPGYPQLMGSYVHAHLALGPSSQWSTVRIRFGYGNGDAGTDGPPIITYASAWTECAQGCSITLPSPAGAVFYYQVERLDDQTSMSRRSTINYVVTPSSQ